MGLDDDGGQWATHQCLHCDGLAELGKLLCVDCRRIADAAAAIPRPAQPVDERPAALTAVRRSTPAKGYELTVLGVERGDPVICVDCLRCRETICEATPATIIGEPERFTGWLVDHERRHVDDDAARTISPSEWGDR